MLKVADLMSKEVFAAKPDDSVAKAKSLMQLARIRHVPIVSEQGEFLGLVTQRDVLSLNISRLAEIDQQTQQELDSGIPLREIMKTDVLVVEPEDLLKSAAQKLLDNKYGCLPVVKEGKLVGILTEADFVGLVISLLDALDKETTV